MKYVKIAVCDVCEEPGRKVRVYRIGLNQGLRKVHLCEEHAAPVKAILDSTTPKRTYRVTTEEELEERLRQVTAPKRKPRVEHP